MSNSPTRKGPAIIMMRAAPEFKKRFDDACEYKGWKIQKALEKVLTQWMSDIEAEQRDSKKLRLPSKPSSED